MKIYTLKSKKTGLHKDRDGYFTPLSRRTRFFIDRDEAGAQTDRTDEPSKVGTFKLVEEDN